MGASEDIEYLKSLVARLNDKIAALESKTKKPAPTPTKTPAQQLRTILVGPPGAGMRNDFFTILRNWWGGTGRDAEFPEGRDVRLRTFLSSLWIVPFERP